MDLTKILRTVLMLAVLMSLAACRRRRNRGGTRRRFHRSHGEDTIAVHVNRKSLDMYPGDSLTVRCRARCAAGDMQVPLISFYKEMGTDAILPLGPSTYGTKVIPLAIKTARNHKYTKNSMKLYILPKFYELMTPGPNTFFCQASDSYTGASQSAVFTVNKIV